MHMFRCNNAEFYMLSLITVSLLQYPNKTYIMYDGDEAEKWKCRASVQVSFMRGLPMTCQRYFEPEKETEIFLSRPQHHHYFFFMDFYFIKTE